MDTQTFWEESSPATQHVKFESGSSTEGSTLACKEEQSIFHYCDGNLNFATVATSEDDEFSFHKKKVSRDPMSHRIIEKRRRDRMNNCLADLSRLIPADYLKKGRGRIEKTEIIEMAIKHMKHLQSHACRQQDSCEMSQQQSQEEPTEQHPAGGPIVIEHYRLGYQECLSETMHFMVEVEGFFAGDPLCVQLINHLQKHCDKILKGDRLNFPRTHLGETTSTSSGSTGSGSYTHHHGNAMTLGSSGLGSSSSPGSGSGSCSDSGRTENKDSGVCSRMPSVSQPGSSSQTSGNEDSCCEEGLVNLSGPSQLREMLTSSNLNALATSQAGANSTTLINAQHSMTSISHHGFHTPVSPSLSHTVGNSVGGTTDHSTVNGGCAASLYKFKNNIKQRFTAEHHEDRRQEKPTINRDSPMNLHHVNKRRRYENEGNDDGCLAGNNLMTLMPPIPTKRRNSETCSVPSPPTSPTPKYPPMRSPSPDLSRMSPSCPQKQIPPPAYGIPIFALHSKGSFYIPLTLDAEVLAPYLAAFGFGSDLQNVSSNSVVLHPVTISVNFQQTTHFRTNQTKHCQIDQCSQMLPWKNESNSFMTLPKWSVCTPERV